MVRTVPARAAAASVVGSPSGESAQPSGILSPRFWAAMMLPLAIMEVAKSILTGKPLPVGNDAAIGFVPKKAWQAPSGDIAGSQLVMANRIMFWPAARLQ